MRALLTLLIAISLPALAQDAAGNPLPPPASAPPSMSLDAAPAPGTEPNKVRLYLNDGQELSCELVSETRDKITVRLGSGAPFEIARSSIRAIEDASAQRSPENYFRDPNITRTFYAPTAFRLRQGELYFSQKELIFSSFGYGVTDNFSVMVGSMVPLWFAGQAQNVIAGAKFGWDASDVWHLAVGAQGLAMPGGLFGSFGGGPGVLGMAFGTVTVGTPISNITLSAGELGTNMMGGSGQGTLIIVGSASWRVAPNVALETENWFFPNFTPSFGEPVFMLNSAGVRLMNQTIAADLGFIRLPGSLIPVPWVDFTYTLPGT